MPRLLREPLIQFLVIGAAIYAAYAWLGAPRDDPLDNRIVVDTARIEGLAGQWRQRWNRPPTRVELDGVIDAFVRESILYRAAVEMGLDRDDPITRRRMAQKLEFLTNDIARVKEPAPGELEDYFAANAALYKEPDRVSFVHVYLDPDRRGAALLDDADALLERLTAAGPADPDALRALGDRTMVQTQFTDATDLDVRRQLGTEFADTLNGLEPGRWHGPVRSGFGVHLVYVVERRAAPAAVFAEARDVVLADWQRQQQAQFNEAFYESLKARFEVVIDEVPDGLVLERAAALTRNAAADADS